MGSSSAQTVTRNVLFELQGMRRWGFELELCGQCSGPGQLGQERAEVLGQRRHLLLLDLEGHKLRAHACLEIEHPLAGFALGPDRDAVDLRKLECAHDGLSSVNV